MHTNYFISEDKLQRLQIILPRMRKKNYNINDAEKNLDLPIS